MSGQIPRRIIVESPFAGDVARNMAYARAAMRDCLLRGEAPFASHLLYTQPGVFDDDDPTERWRGIDAGIAWGGVADGIAVYVDLGISKGMRYGIERYRAMGKTIEYRKLLGWTAK